MVRLWRCEICGDPYIGESPPANCPFCGAHGKYIKEASAAKVTFDIPLTEKEKANASHALEVELRNAAFYSCASSKTDDEEGKLLFKALAKVESEHASIWKKILGLSEMPEIKASCSSDNTDNLQESHHRETMAIEFYRRAASEAVNQRLRQIFDALIEIETDHLQLSEERLAKNDT